MGSSASVNNKLPYPYHCTYHCPYHKLLQAKLKKAKTAHYIHGQASEFYYLCSNGELDKVHEILEAPGRLSIDELVKLESNGDTALHVATEKGHVEIVKLLLEHKCSPAILNRSGKVASEEATTPVMQQLFIRPTASGRFHDDSTTKTMTHFLPRDNKINTTSSRINTTSNGTDATSSRINATSNRTDAASNRTDAASSRLNATSNETDVTSKETNAISEEAVKYFKPFDTEDEVNEHSLNHQTMAMWLKFYNWFSRTFPSFFQRENLNLESFQLHNDYDFKYFLAKKLGKMYKDTLAEFNKAQKENSIEPLLTVYSEEACGFYQSLNRQLVDVSSEADASPHLCDRFIIEFHIRGDELAKRSFLGIAYRGATIALEDLELYEKVCKNKPRGVIAFTAFTSTSEDKDVALKFIPPSPKSHQMAVLFIIETNKISPTIVGIADVSKFPNEKEILFMPGNLFTVQKIVKDVVTYTKDQRRMVLTEIYLEYLHIPVSFWKKLWHTYKSGYNSVTQ